MSDRLTETMMRIDSGDGSAATELFPLVYDELKRRAVIYLAQQRTGHTLQPTAVVHEAYLKLVAAGDHKWESRRHFFNAAAEAMRQILVDHARAKASLKRGGAAARRIDLEAADLPPAPEEDTDWESLDRAFVELKRDDPRRYQVVMHRFFAGLENAKVAELLDVSERTVERDWKLAKMYLKGKLASSSSETKES